MLIRNHKITNYQIFFFKYQNISAMNSVPTEREMDFIKVNSVIDGIPNSLQIETPDLNELVSNFKVRIATLIGFSTSEIGMPTL